MNIENTLQLIRTAMAQIQAEKTSIQPALNSRNQTNEDFKKTSVRLAHLQDAEQSLLHAVNHLNYLS